MSYLARVTTKGTDVLLDPLQRELLVAQTKVERAGIGKRLAGREAPDAEAVVDGDEDDGLAAVLGALDESRRAEGSVQGAGAAVEAAAIADISFFPIIT